MLSSCLFSLTYSQTIFPNVDQTKIEIQYGISSSFEVWDVYQQNKITYTSLEDLDKIPKHSLYHTIFISILEHEADYREYFTEADWLLIELLPSHGDRSIVLQQFSSMQSTCFTFENSVSMGVSFPQVVELYVETAEQADKFLDDHYVEAFNLLSIEGQAYFNMLIEGYRGTKRLAYGSVNFQKVADRIPEEAYKIMELRCTQISEIDFARIPTGKTLKSDLEEARLKRRILNPVDN